MSRDVDVVVVGGRVAGASTASSGNWSDFNLPFCTSALRLYCVQQ